jgi:hypothetical protein
MVIIGFVLILTILSTGLAKLISTFLQYGFVKKKSAGKDSSSKASDLVSITNIKKKVSFEQYLLLRKNTCFGHSLACTILYFNITGEATQSFELCTHYHRMEMQFNGQHSELTDMFYFEKLGTNSASMRLYDCIECSIGVRVDKFLIKNVDEHLLAYIAKITDSSLIQFIKYCYKAVLYYADIIKDLYLLGQIWKIMLGSSYTELFNYSLTFPLLVFWVTLVSILASELCNLLSLIQCETYTNWSRTQTCLSWLFMPLVPGIMFYKELKANRKVSEIVAKLRKYEGSQTAQTQYADHYLLEYITLSKAHKVRTEFKANENVVEHFVQLIVVILIILLNWTATKNVLNLDKMFLNDKVVFQFFSTMSCLSVILGQLSYISAQKSSFLPLQGYILLSLHIAISLAAKVFFILLCYTPILGLFDTNYHEKLGFLETSLFGGLLTLYDVKGNEGCYEAWRKSGPQDAGKDFGHDVWRGNGRRKI